MKLLKLGILCDCGTIEQVLSLYLAEGHRLMVRASCEKCKKTFVSCFTLGFLFTQCPDPDLLKGLTETDTAFLKEAKILPL